MNVTSRVLLSGVSVAVVVASLAIPAQATLQVAIDVGGTPFFCADNGACDSNPATGTLTLSNLTINGVVLSGSMFSIGTPANPSFSNADSLDLLNLSINNTTNTTQAITATLGDTSFSSAVVAVFESIGSGPFQSMSGAIVDGSFFYDPANAQGAGTVTDTPGTLLANFSATDNQPTHIFFAQLQVPPVLPSAPFSMTQTVSISLAANTQFVGYDQIENAVAPEPSTWAMMLIGFAGLGFAFRSRRSAAFSGFVFRLRRNAAFS
jgi:hypothetical protein